MLQEICLRNFKCFQDRIAIPVSQFNLLTGINGRGKSTALQTLLLMRQSIEHSRTTNRLVFNGSCIDLGNFNDVRNSNISQKEAIEIEFGFNDHTRLHYFLYEDELDEMSVQINKVHIHGLVNDITLSASVELEDKQYIARLNSQRFHVHWQDLAFRSLESEHELFTTVRNKVNFGKIHYIWEFEAKEKEEINPN